jgi:hypothetical protein
MVELGPNKPPRSRVEEIILVLVGIIGALSLLALVMHQLVTNSTTLRDDFKAKDCSKAEDFVKCWGG